MIVGRDTVDTSMKVVCTVCKSLVPTFTPVLDALLLGDLELSIPLL